MSGSKSLSKIDASSYNICEGFFATMAQKKNRMSNMNTFAGLAAVEMQKCVWLTGPPPTLCLECIVPLSDLSGQF